MNLFTPNKSASPPKDSDNRGVEPSVGPSPSSQTNPDLEALVRQQAAELEGLRRRLEKAELASPKTPRLTTEALAEFRGRERLAGWMKQTAESLEQYVQQVPRADMEGTEDLTPGEVLANRVWDTLWDSHKAYEGRQRAREYAESAEGKQLHALRWSQASAHPTDSFRWRGVRFVREGGVLKWVNASGRKVPVSAPAPGEYRRCKAHSPETTAPKHWHFRCPHWAWLDDLAGGGWGGRRAAFCSRAVPAVVAPEVASGFVASFAGLAFAWERLAKSDERAYPRVAAMHSWKQRTRQRYGSAIHQLAELEACIPARPLPEILSLRMAERAADGHSASGLRGLASAVRAAEDLALVPRVVAAPHWRIAKLGRGPGPQEYVSPRALVHIWNAATAPDDRAVAALAGLSWTMWLRVGEAASIRCCDLDRKEGLWFYSTKVGEPGWVCRPAAAYARSWMEFLRVYCQAKGKQPEEPVFDGGPPFLEDTIGGLLRDTKWADARWHALRRGGSAACWVRKSAAQYFLFWGRWAGLRTAMGYALGFRDPEVVGNLVLPHVNEAVGLGPRGTVLSAALWGMAMCDLSRFAEPPMDPPHPSPPPLLGPTGSTLVEDVQEEHGVGAAAADDPEPCPSPAVAGPPSEPRPTSPSPACAPSASPGLPPDVIVLSDSDSDADVGDGSGVCRGKECVPNMGSVAAPADAFRVGAPGAGGVGSRKRPRDPGSRRQQYAPPPSPCPAVPCAFPVPGGWLRCGYPDR